MSLNPRIVLFHLFVISFGILFLIFGPLTKDTPVDPVRRDKGASLALLADQHRIDVLETRVERLRERLNRQRHLTRQYKKRWETLQRRLGGNYYPPMTYNGPRNARGDAVVRLARQFVGRTWYVWGGCSHSGTDCSGLVLHVYAEVGIYLSHGATYQQRASRQIPLSALQPGDLVFYGSYWRSYHVAIYIGGGRTIEASHSGTLVGYGSVAGAWTGGTFFH
jgi:NlpC/P60 family